MYNTLKDYRWLYQITKNFEEVKVANEKAPTNGRAESISKNKTILLHKYLRFYLLHLCVFHMHF